MEGTNVVTPDPLCWHQGMLLSPQHFQQDQLFWQAQLQIMRQSLSPNGWGILNLQLDKGHLSDGTVNITRLIAIMPDGMTIHHDSVFDGPQDGLVGKSLLLDVSELVEMAKHNQTKVYLAVPRQGPGCVSTDKAQYQRYESYESAAVIDDNTGENELAVQRLKAKLKLVAHEQLDENDICLPLCVIERKDDGVFVLGDYCPPVLQIRAQDFIFDDEQNEEAENVRQEQLAGLGVGVFHIARECRQLTVLMRRKARHLAGYSAEGEDRLGVKVSEQHSKWIQALTRNLLEIELLAYDGHTHPEALYLVLSRMMGSFTELALSNIPKKLPVYNHQNMLEGFKKALSYLYTQLEQVNIRFSSLSFEENQHGHFSISYDRKWQERDLLIELIGPENVSTNQLKDWFEACRVVSTDRVDALRELRVIGAPREFLESDKQTGLSTGVNRALFRIKYRQEFITIGRRLMVFCTVGELRQHKPKRIMLHLPHEQENQE